MGVDNMRRRQLRGDLTMKNEYGSDRNINDWDITHYAQVVDGMKNKLVVDSEQQEHIGGVVDSGGLQRRRKTKTSRSSTWIQVDDANTRNDLEYRDGRYRVGSRFFSDLARVIWKFSA